MSFVVWILSVNQGRTTLAECSHDTVRPVAARRGSLINLGIPLRELINEVGPACLEFFFTLANDSLQWYCHCIYCMITLLWLNIEHTHRTHRIFDYT